jgi:hypothetical protein
MHMANSKPREQEANDAQCVICATWLRSGYVCEACARRGLDSRQFAEIFWDEA